MGSWVALNRFVLEAVEPRSAGGSYFRSILGPSTLRLREKDLAEDLHSRRQELSSTEARSGRIVKGGAIRRILLVATALAIVAMAIVYTAMV
jgi:hypothetical protein